MTQGNQPGSVERRRTPRGSAMLRGIGVLALLAVGAIVALATLRPNAKPRLHDAGALKVVVSVAPLMWPVRVLAPEASVTLLAPAGAGCEGVDLTPSNVLALERADLVVLTGLGLEPQIERLLANGKESGRNIVRMADVLSEGERNAAEHNHKHEAGDEHADHQHSPDQHLWLDPVLMARFVDHLVQRMAERSGVSGVAATPSAGNVRQASATAVAVDGEYRRGLAPFAGRGIVTQHAAFDRLADRYGLIIAAVLQREHGAEPTPGDIAAAAEAVRQSGASAVFVEPQLPSDAARRVAEVTGVRVLSLDPLGDGDWPGMMRRNLAVLVEGLSGFPQPEAARGQE